MTSQSIFVAMILASTLAMAQPAVDLPRLSPAATVSQSIGYTKATVQYSRPAVNGRVIWGGVVPYGQVWRAGANEATTLEISTDARIGGQVLPKGKYAFFVLPSEKEWILIFNRNSGDWGSFNYDGKQDVLRLTVVPREAEHRERLEYGFEDLTDSSAILYLHWEKRKASLPLVVEFLETAKANIKTGLPKAKPDDPYAHLNAARFYWKYGLDRKQAMEWVNQSIRAKSIHANLWTKAEWLGEQKQYAEALKTAKLARAEAEKSPNPKPLLDAIDKAEAAWKAASKKK